MENPIGGGAAFPTLYALSSNVRKLEGFEESSDRLSSEIASLEQKANDHIQSLRNSVALFLTYCGGGIYFQKTPVSCPAVLVITSVFILWILVVIWETHVSLRRMRPKVRKLVGWGEKLASDAQELRGVERTRMEVTLNVVERRYLSHPSVEIGDLSSRCEAIEGFSNEFLTDFGWYYKVIVLAMVICVIITGATLCCIAYFSYCGADASKLHKPEDATTYYAAYPYNIYGYNYARCRGEGQGSC